IQVQTEMYLEELKDFREERNNYCQTDLFIDRPPTPYFVPEKIGLDKETQIYDGELFDFDIEVLPVLEVLVGKVVEQALLEVQEEEELAALKEQQRIFEELRNADFEEQQRLEEQERRIKQEKMERLRQEISRQKRAKQLEKKISAIAYSKGYIGNLISGTFGDLISGKYFYDDKEKDIELNFWESLLNETSQNIKSNVLGRRLLD
ncbi:hypothetical protein HELRODRAFT_143766, partial [Helobdella robusta]|uniref:Radial spoke head 3 n=1 Tax=Helobdella robusta TaxID=6412 RepID=T1EJC2_HELRO